MPLGGHFTARSLNMISPPLGVSRPLISFKSVDLPQPDGPMIDRKLRRSMLQLSLSNTVRSPCFDLNVLLRLRTSMIGCAGTARGPVAAFADLKSALTAITDSRVRLQTASCNTTAAGQEPRGRVP